MKVPKGTPITVATVSPVNIKAIAEALFSGRTTSAAITVEMDMKIPWASEASTRPTKSKIKVGAKAESKLPRINKIIMATIKVFRFQVPVRIVSNGAPTVTPSA